MQWDNKCSCKTKKLMKLKLLDLHETKGAYILQTMTINLEIVDNFV